jgi:hypothetical protein
MALTLSLVFAAACAKSSDESDGEYRLIVRWNGKPIACGPDRGATFPLAHLQQRDGWYGKQLRATGQSALCSEAAPPEKVFRFTWLPSFHPTVMVRVEQRGATHILHAVTLSGVADSSPRPARDTTISLTQREWGEWLRLVAAARFWQASTAQSESAIGPDGKIHELAIRDGARWLLEARSGAQYHAVDRWALHDKQLLPYRRACEWLLRRSGLVDSAVVAAY